MTIAKGDFVDLVFTGKADGVIFDSNDADELKKVNSEHKPQPLRVIVGQHMLVSGLDEALIGKLPGQPFQVHVAAKKGFGERKPQLVRPIPLAVFISQKIMPEPGMTLLLDQSLVTIRAVSGARVITDFNNPLAGKDLDYSAVITRKIDDIKEKSEVFFEWFLRSKPEIEVENSVIVKADEKFEPIVNMLKEKFKELVGKDLDFRKSEKPTHEVKHEHQATQ